MSPSHMPPERIEEIRGALAEVPAAPWHWIGDTLGGPILATKYGGWRTVMAFRRMGMRGAQPVFPVQMLSPTTGKASTFLLDARELMVARAPYDPKTIRGIDNPVARWFEHSPEYVAELLAEVDRLKDRAARQDETILGLLGRRSGADAVTLTVSNLEGRFELADGQEPAAAARAE